MTLALYAQKLLSSGKACALARLTLWEWEELLGKRQIPRHYSEADLAEDLGLCPEPSVNHPSAKQAGPLPLVGLAETGFELREPCRSAASGSRPTTAVMNTHLFTERSTDASRTADPTKLPAGSTSLCPSDALSAARTRRRKGWRCCWSSSPSWARAVRPNRSLCGVR